MERRSGAGSGASKPADAAATGRGGEHVDGWGRHTDPGQDGPCQGPESSKGDSSKGDSEQVGVHQAGVRRRDLGRLSGWPDRPTGSPWPRQPTSWPRRTSISRHRRSAAGHVPAGSRASSSAGADSSVGPRSVRSSPRHVGSGRRTSSRSCSRTSAAERWRPDGPDGDPPAGPRRAEGRPGPRGARHVRPRRGRAAGQRPRLFRAVRGDPDGAADPRAGRLDRQRPGCARAFQRGDHRRLPTARAAGRVRARRGVAGRGGGVDPRRDRPRVDGQLALRRARRGVRTHLRRRPGARHRPPHGARPARRRAAGRDHRRARGRGCAGDRLRFGDGAADPAGAARSRRSACRSRS